MMMTLCVAVTWLIGIVKKPTVSVYWSTDAFTPHQISG